ncbi:uncharacterized protein LOC135639199 [Musa acuminata AAA Group]|uniref:uncharacterized protein LOC135639199 n=1 Tax=Musa acuminata AAA Group TaxID=214697 RepID=UPI0031DCB01F
MDVAWPFAQWGLNLLGPFPPASGQWRFLIVGVDYFMKWVEVEPLASITKKQVQSFMWKNIITRFGIPKAIIADNGTRFNNIKFKAYCQSYGIQLKFSSVALPQTNDQTEVMNRTILEGLKRRISGAHGAWVDELPSVLWAMRTTPKTVSGESLFNLAFGTEAVLPTEMLFPTLRTSNYQQGDFEEGLRANLDLLEEGRAKAHLRILSYKKVVAWIYNRRVRSRLIKIRDLVLQRAKVSNPTRARGKLSPNWEDPYRVYDMVLEGTYQLESMEGSPLPRTWNTTNLKKFYP